MKNAHEAGSTNDEVTLAVATTRNELRFEVSDRGPGMSETVLAQALLPFYTEGTETQRTQKTHRNSVLSCGYARVRVVLSVNLPRLE